MVLISTEYETISIYDLSKQRRAIDAADFPCSLCLLLFLFGSYRINRFPVRAAKSAEFQVLFFFNLKLKCQHIINNLNCVWNGSIILIALI